MEKMTPKQYMRQVERIDKRIASKRAELDYLRELAVSVSAISYHEDKVQAGYVPHDSRQSRQQMRITELEAQLCADINHMITIHSDVNRIIDALHTADEQLVLRYRYIDGLNWNTIAEQLGYNVRHVLRIHGNALQHIRYE